VYFIKKSIKKTLIFAIIEKMHLIEKFFENVKNRDMKKIIKLMYK
jgi:hypothetical protein